MRKLPWVLIAVLAGCDGGGKDECEPADRIAQFPDADGDGYGAGEETRGCRVAAGFAAEDGDCDDADPDRHPEAEERCNGLDDDCDDALDDGLAGAVFFVDDDGDRFGNHDVALTACRAPPGYVPEDTDCDDTNGDVSPAVAEVCNGGVDDDCDGFADDLDEGVLEETKTTFYRDQDGDGFGRPDRSLLACAAPEGAAAPSTDCDDDEATVNPDAPETCNEVDDDCDGLFDHLDPDIDDATLVDAFADADRDGAGDPASPVRVCRFRVGFGVENDQDCDDGDADVNPLERERYCNTVDDDCDAATLDDPDLDGDGFFRCQDDCDDGDALVFPGGVETEADGVDGDCDGTELCYEDADDDGLRGRTLVEAASPNCQAAGFARPEDPSECFDDDPLVVYSGDWALDADLDGWGDGVLALTDCADPGAGYAPLERLDCDDADPAVSPGALDPCGDGTDQDCDGNDVCRTCRQVLDGEPASASGVVSLTPDSRAFDVWCDQETDGGGWTLVGSAFGAPFPDRAVAWDEALATLTPTTTTDGVWNGLRENFGTHTDLRFVCATTSGDAPTVDLSFYDVDWYEQITRYNNDAFTCFQVNYYGYNETPARRDNLAGTELGADDPYAAGMLVGESFCGAPDDFTVDFTDAGSDGDENDGTDWGMDDGVPKCGTQNVGETWFLFAREAR